MEAFDIIIIGAGPGGYVTAFKALIESPGMMLVVSCDCLCVSELNAS
jgi:pyruvate/2-oxoglutarate dehydrogenase complex dihydrolipoamide dehydrogenase (E3) component